MLVVCLPPCLFVTFTNACPNHPMLLCFGTRPPYHTEPITAASVWRTKGNRWAWESGLKLLPSPQRRRSSRLAVAATSSIRPSKVPSTCLPATTHAPKVRRHYLFCCHDVTPFITSHTGHQQHEGSQAHATKALADGGARRTRYHGERYGAEEIARAWRR